MRRTLTNTLYLGCTMFVAACGDQPTAPAGPTLAPLPPAANVYVNAYTNGAEATDVDFTVTQSGGWFALGSSAVYFPAGSICDPATSSYGIGHWDEPCTPASAPVRIHAHLDKAAQRVDFSPALRFVPAGDSWKWVYLYVFSPKLAEKAKQSGGSKYTLLWMPDGATTGINEALTDESLQTKVDKQHGLAYRRVKHFSGFQIVLGFAGDGVELSY